MLLQRTHVLRDHLRTDEAVLCTRLAAKYDPFYANEYEFQVEYDQLVMALCRAYRIDFTQLSALLERRADWHQLSQRFINDSITPVQYCHRRWAYDHLVRISQLNKQKQDREIAKSTPSQELVNVN